MGFYLRKSVRVGPFRFNLSKSGIGVSAGIPGLRVGTGPRGNYIHAGRGGFYYRATIPSSNPSSPNSPTPRTLLPSPAPDSTIGPEVEIESGSVEAMRDETSAGLLAELSMKRSRLRFAPFALVGLGWALVANWSAMSSAWQLIAAAVAAACVIALHQVDVVRKSTVLMYDLEGEARNHFEALLAATTRLSQARRLWHISSRAEVLDPKYHAGAADSINRKSTSLYLGSAPMVTCNVDVPVLSVGRQVLCFFPDRLLVFDRGSVGAVGYPDLHLDRTTTRFIEEEGVPSDSHVVGRTWRYVNKKGGPDRRFKDNPELPICEYEALHFRSNTGLNELLHSSLVGAGELLSRFLAEGGVRQSGDPM